MHAVYIECFENIIIIITYTNNFNTIDDLQCMVHSSNTFNINVLDIN